MTAENKDKVNGKSMNHAKLSGKVTAINRIPSQKGTIFQHLLVIPAATEYEYPTTLAVNSYAKECEPGELVTFQATLSGRSWRYTDKETGEEKTSYSCQPWIEGTYK